MAEKILYLLGAGASAHALPLVKANPNRISLSQAMRNMGDFIQADQNLLLTTDQQIIFYRKVSEDLLWLAQEAEKHTTIDTYAKYLYLKNDQRYERLKFVLSVYFALEQIHNKRLDNRYLVWLISILDKEMFPENVKILTWNYDFQVELTAEKFRKEKHSHIRGGTTKYTPPLIQYYPCLGRNDRDLKEYSLLHLNGIAGFYNHDDGIDFHTFLDHDQNNEGKYLDRFIEKAGYNKLHFAWEKRNQEVSIKILNEMVKDVTILVVIGYSFPFFNREMDKAVYKALDEWGNLKKIYFQDPNRDGSFLRSQFGYSDMISIEHIKEVDALYIPFEL